MPSEHCTVQELCTLLDDLVKWQKFALQLPGINSTDVETIELNKHDDIEEQKRILYQKWLEVCPDASWEDVIKTLEKVRLTTIAKKVREAISTTAVQPMSPQQQEKVRQLTVY